MYVSITHYDSSDRELSEENEYFRVPSEAFDEYGYAVSEMQATDKVVESVNAVNLSSLTRTVITYADGTSTIVRIF